MVNFIKNLLENVIYFWILLSDNYLKNYKNFFFIQGRKIEKLYKDNMPFCLCGFMQ